MLSMVYLPEPHEKAPGDESKCDARRHIARAHDEGGQRVARFISPAPAFYGDPGEFDKDGRNEERYGILHHVGVGDLVGHAGLISDCHRVRSSCDSAKRAGGTA